MKLLCKLCFSLLFFVCLTQPDVVMAQRKSKKSKKHAKAPKKKKVVVHTRKYDPPKPLVREAVSSVPKQEDANLQPIIQPIAINEQDTNTIKSVTITSEFKPTLRKAVKLNFSAATPVVDTVSIPLSYQIPTQNLFFNYQPVPLKPLALTPDSVNVWKPYMFGKLGMGNYAGLLAEWRWVNPVGNNLFSYYLLHQRTEGAMRFQDAQKTVFTVDALTKLKQNDWTNSFTFQNTNQYQYGFNTAIPFSKTDLKRNFTYLTLQSNLQPSSLSNTALLHNSNVVIQFAKDNYDVSEWNIKPSATIQKKLDDNTAFNLKTLVDLTFLQSPLPGLSSNNHLFLFSPNIQTQLGKWQSKLGIQTGWDLNKFIIVPDIVLTNTSLFKQTKIEAGFTGNVIKNNFTQFTQINPFIKQVSSLNNTVEQAIFVQATKKISASQMLVGGVSFVKWNDMPIYLQDSLPALQHQFYPTYESSISAFLLKAEYTLIFQDKFKLLSGMKYYLFTGQEKYKKPFGFIPFSAQASATYAYSADMQFKADLFFYDGINYGFTNGTTGKQSAIADLNIGTEIKLLPKLHFWLQVNNVLGSNYQRWNNYPVNGISVLTGAIYHFK